MNKCPKCNTIQEHNILCPECFFEEFEKQTGVKPSWIYDEKKKEWVQVYKGIDFKEPRK
jgi:ribosomal protein L32